MVRSADEIRERVEQMMLDEYFGEGDRAHATALLAATEYGADVGRIVAETRLDEGLVYDVVRNLETSEFWYMDAALGAVRPHTERWEDGIPHGPLSFGVWLLVAQGSAICTGVDSDGMPTVLMPDVFFDKQDVVNDGE